jgi:hypothetical protein
MLAAFLPKDKETEWPYLFHVDAGFDAAILAAG